MSMEHLITDRTKADVDRWAELKAKGLANMTEAEKAEWMGFLKGSYNFTDMNRVEEAVVALSERMHEMGYPHDALTTKTDWNYWSVPTRTDMIRYFGNVATIRAAIPVYGTTPATPTVNSRFNYSRANDLEKILVDVDEILTNIPKAMHYAGEVFSGEV